MSYTGRFRRAVTTNTLKKLKGNIGPSVGPDDKDEILVKGDPDDPIITSGNSATHTLEIQVKDAATAQRGVVALATQSETNAGTNSDKAVVPSTLKTKLGAQTDKGIPYGDGSGNPIKWSDAMADGQVMIGSTSGDPAPANITSSDGSLSVVSGSNSIDLKTGGKISSSIHTEQGTATPSSGSFNLFGDDLIDTVATGNTINVNTKESVMSEARAGGTRVFPKGHVIKFWNGQYTFATGNAQGGAVTIDVKQTVASFLQPDSGGNAAASNRTFKVEGGTGCTTKRNSTGDGVVVDVTSSGGSGLPLVFITAKVTNMLTNRAYIVDYSALYPSIISSPIATLKLPTVASKGDKISVTAGKYVRTQIIQNSGDQITVGFDSTTRGTGGSLMADTVLGSSITLYLHSTTSTTKNWRVYGGFFGNVRSV